MLHLRMKEHELRQKAIFWSLNLQELRRATAPGADRGMETRTGAWRRAHYRAHRRRGHRTARPPGRPGLSAGLGPRRASSLPCCPVCDERGAGATSHAETPGGTAGACLQGSPHLWRGEAFRPSPERPSSLRPAWGRGRAPHGRASLLGDTAPGAQALSPAISAVPTASRGRPGRTGDTRRRAGSGTTCGRGKPRRPRSAGASRLRFPDTRVSLRTR